MPHINLKDVHDYVKKTSQEASEILYNHLLSYFEQGISRERVIENMNRHVKLAIRTLDEVLGFLGPDDEYF